jgi:molybdenum cofactor biosynthesis protein B
MLCENAHAPAAARSGSLARGVSVYAFGVDHTLTSIIGSVSVTEHRKTAVAGVRCYVLTISDTRTQSTDASGDAIVELLEAAGHIVAGRAILRDDPGAVRKAVSAQLGAVDAVITTGGTGITSRDSTYEALERLLDKRLDGFGELFRALSFQEVGSAAMMTRAAGGVADATAVFMLPGSEQAVRLGMTRLIVPELGHVIRELRR